ncbi:hypothetical protein MLD38_009040 [Melastoma candidum]|uniref:Uncharacterized protein n=1 Tax=Melastoma candidum TaxID=119954 RepID=A0ACB9RXP6_9MYRT|nr:hypothetical protein MLD38_009040 [Melastoma candidum]
MAYYSLLLPLQTSIRDYNKAYDEVSYDWLPSTTLVVKGKENAQATRIYIFTKKNSRAISTGCEHAVLEALDAGCHGRVNSPSVTRPRSSRTSPSILRSSRRISLTWIFCLLHAQKGESLQWCIVLEMFLSY